MKNRNLVEKVFCFVLKVPDREFAHLTIKMLVEHFAISRFKEQWGESPGRYRKLIGGLVE